MRTGKCLNSAEITASVTACANLMAKNLSGDELSLLAAIFTQLADTLTTISVVREINESNCNGDNDNDNDNNNKKDSKAN